MTDIFEEVEEAHRKDKVDEAWQKYGWIVWLAGAAVILAVAANEYLSWQRAETQAANAAQLEAAIEALEAGEYESAETQFQAIVDQGEGLAPLAAQYLAQVRIEGLGNTEAAIEALESAAGGEADPLRKLALLKAAYLKSDTTPLAELETMLVPLLEGDTPMSALAQELVAAKAFEEGDFDRARREFNFLRFAPNAPPGLAQRADIALAAIPRPAADPEVPEVSGDGGPSLLPSAPTGAETDAETATDGAAADDAGATPNDPDDLGEQ